MPCIILELCSVTFHGNDGLYVCSTDLSDAGLSMVCICTYIACGIQYVKKYRCMRVYLNLYTHPYSMPFCMCICICVCICACARVCLSVCTYICSMFTYEQIPIILIVQAKLSVVTLAILHAFTHVIIIIINNIIIIIVVIIIITNRCRHPQS